MTLAIQLHKLINVQYISITIKLRFSYYLFNITNKIILKHHMYGWWHPSLQLL